MSFLPLLEKGNRSKPSSKTRWTSTVINITSISGTVRTSQNHFGYNASKAAANHLTTMLSHELNFGASPKTGTSLPFSPSPLCPVRESRAQCN